MQAVSYFWKTLITFFLGISSKIGLERDHGIVVRIALRPFDHSRVFSPGHSTGSDNFSSLFDDSTKSNLHLLCISTFSPLAVLSWLPQ